MHLHFGSSFWLVWTYLLLCELTLNPISTCLTAGPEQTGHVSHRTLKSVLGAGHFKITY